MYNTAHQPNPLATGIIEQSFLGERSKIPRDLVEEGEHTVVTPKETFSESAC